MLNPSRKRPVWPFALLGAVLGLALLTVAGLWVIGVYSMSDPERPLLVGIRIDGTRISVKAPTCPTDTVGKVQVFDSESERLLWQASDPKTPEGKRGAVTLWNPADFLKPGPEAQPVRLPANLDVSFEYAGGEDGTGDVFNIPKVKAAHLPEGHYWTSDGPMTAQALDNQLKCVQDGQSSS